MVYGGMSCIKYLLAFFNFVFLVCGIVLVAVGGVLQHELLRYQPFSAHSLTTGPALLITVGVFIALLSFLGCCGALKENHCMTMTFSILLSLIIILEIAGTAAAFIFSHQIEKLFKEGMENSLRDYNQSEKITKLWDSTQHGLKCCGVSGADDWLKENRSVIPSTCCPGVPEDCKKNDAYKKGCLKAIEEALGGQAYISASVGLAFVFLEIVGVLFGCYLARSIRRQYEVV